MIVIEEMQNWLWVIPIYLGSDFFGQMQKIA